MAKDIRLKLLINRSTNKVVFGEARKDFVDLLFSTVVNYGKMYASLLSLDDKNLDFNVAKSFLDQNALLLQNDPSLMGNDKCYYRCNSTGSSCNRNIYTDVKGTSCPQCSSQMTVQISYVVPNAVKGRTAGTSGGEAGYVIGGVATYMVTDDLVVTPMSTISSITLLNKLQVKEIDSLEEKVVRVHSSEVIRS